MKIVISIILEIIICCSFVTFLDEMLVPKQFKRKKTIIAVIALFAIALGLLIFVRVFPFTKVMGVVINK